MSLIQRNSMALRKLRNATFTIMGVALIGSLSLSGCIYQFIAPHEGTVEWHQPGLWDAFPEDGQVGDFRIINHGSYVNAALLETKRVETVTVTKFDDVSYRLSVKPQPLSSDGFWENMRDAFEALSLPEPTLDPEYEFSLHAGKAWARWEQPGLWDGFPEEGTTGDFDVFVHDSLKVSQKVDNTTSTWVRVDESDNVSFRFQVREPRDQPRLSDFNMTDEAWKRLIQAFEDLGLPEPALRGPEEINPIPWSRLDPV